MTYKVLFWILLSIVVIVVAVFGTRVYHHFHKKQMRQNTYAIQNIGTSRCIRPYNAGLEDENRVILYDYKNWECITWQMINIEGDVYMLKNLWTEKTLEPVNGATEGSTMWQKTLGTNKTQHYEFVKTDDNEYIIRIAGSELYLTAPEDKLDADIVLKPQDNSQNQLWRLIHQTPLI